MTDFEDKHSKLLINSPWLSKLHDGTSYLFKCAVSVSDQTCCFLLTDTESVWVEALESRHVARRARQCHKPREEASFSESLADQDAEMDWRRRQLTLLHNLHLPQTAIEAEFSINTQANNSDLEVSIITDDFQWRWDVNRPSHPRASAKLLSTHLIAPLISFTALSTSIDEPLRDISASALTRFADSQAKTAKRSLGRQAVGTLSKPVVVSTLQRMTQVIAGEDQPAPIAIGEEDYPPSMSVPPLPVISGSARRASVSPRRPIKFDNATTFPFSPPPATAAKAQSQPNGLVTSQNDPGNETEDEDDSLPVHAQLSARPAPSSPSEAASSPPPRHRIKRPSNSDDEDDEDAAEAKRRAAISKITQSTKAAAPAIKAAAKRRKF